jgi:hypothetical protein
LLSKDIAKKKKKELEKKANTSKKEIIKFSESFKKSSD